MPRTPSPLSFQFNDDYQGARRSNQLPLTPPITNLLQDTGANTRRLQDPYFMTGQRKVVKKQTEQPARNVGPVQDVPTTQSLIAALQSTMQPKEIRQTVVIPGARRRTPNTEGLPLPTKRLSPLIRLMIVVVAIIIILLLTLLSLAPLGNGQSKFPFFGGAIQWANAQQQSFSTAMGHLMTAQDAQPAAPAQPAQVAAPVQMTLPQSQYITIARQAAANAGINADYFVRQINLESGFNPQARSAAGAVGIAQFIPSTAAGLGINPYDPISSLNGAAKYMASLAGQYGGNYAKALAAYNGGPATVQQAINAGGANWMNFLPAETRNYIRVIMGI